jgi:excisionase family DNA binding protein
MTDEIYTIEEAAKYLKVSDDVIRRMIKDRELKASKIRGQWRIRKTDIDRLFEDQDGKDQQRPT